MATAVKQHTTFVAQLEELWLSADGKHATDIANLIASTPADDLVDVAVRIGLAMREVTSPLTVALLDSAEQDCLRFADASDALLKLYGELATMG